MKHKKTNWGVLVLAAIICACCLGGCAQQAEEISQVSQSVASVSSDVSESIDSTPSSSSNASKSVSSSLPSQESEPSSESASQTSYSSFEEELIPDLKGLTQEECEKYYSDAVFVGDSVMLGFSMFVRDSRKTNPDFLPGIQFHTSGSYGTGNALWDISDDSVHPLLRGQQTKTEDALSILKAKKAFLLFGLNDVGVYGVEGSIENYGTLCDRILEKNPDIAITVLSATPILDGAEGTKLNNQNLSLYNEGLKSFCKEKGFQFLDISSALSLPDGSLRPEFCSDGFVHETYDAYKIWTKLLLENAAAQLSAEADS